MDPKETKTAFSTVGIVAAMDVEVRLLAEALENCEKLEIAGAPYYVGTLGNHKVIATRCGIGKVSAALGTQALITTFAPDCVINTGCAGAMAEGLGIGDIVLSAETAEWDMDTTVLGDPRGFISALNLVRVEADSDLRACIKKYIPEGSTVREGLVVSGDQFISEPAQRAVILGAFPDVLCAEMEGAAIGHVCAQNRVPFCVIRAMSDTADGSSEVSYPVFAAKAGEDSAAVLIAMLKAEA